MTQTDVSLFLAARAPHPETDRLHLAEAVARVCRVELTEVTIAQRCERCGGAHGKPRVLRPPGTFASLSRAASTVAVAVSLAGPIGVDIESVSAVGRAGFDDVAFNGPERLALRAVPMAARDRVRATLWTAKEAVLKLSGAGLTVDPRELTVVYPKAAASVFVMEPRWQLLSWPGASLDLADLHLAGFDAGPGLVGTVAILGPEAPRIVLLPQT
ncbi:4'-phosphopantetheinyl transferase superfamily protein [Cryobacterium sp. TMS1-20-1]|uniref:4'-phosphopantetheinyl transferase family protein n=1 Tax=Cryobacterium sp. TMS1-20-1 TaxID=1259223 RepID=UPI00106A70FF|nr:4'-phosphopantetheinyl transferase superfamily protein [Cryobacterium sp. TMS1-20-1]TFC72480.1 4'-phosphopantetheinyl transferase superfamily protein [Cryobacterium sp. TMS1-20-1]